MQEQDVGQLLQDFRNNYSNLYDFSPAAYITFNREGLIIDGNLACFNILGTDRGNLINTAFSKFMDSKDTDIFYSCLNHIFEKKTKQICELQLIRPNQEKLKIQLHSMVMRYPDNQEVCTSVIKDLTLLDIELKDKFYFLMTHDLRAPFTIMVSLLEILEEDISTAGIKGKTKEMVRIINNFSKTLLSLIDDLIKVGNLQAGQKIVKKRFFDGRSAVNSVIKRLALQMEQKKIVAVNNVPAGTQLYSDFNMYCEVLQNLVHNAVKFSHPAGSIDIYVPDDQPATIAVRDNGTGIIEHMLPKLFKYEEKSSTTGTCGERGSGLGLPFSMDIMNALGGTIKVCSHKGVGTVFNAVLPYIRPVTLIVEDIPETRTLIKYFLRETNTEIFEAKDGISALNLLKNTTVHLIVTDLKMPGMTGLAFIEALKKNPETESLPIIVMTSDEKITTREEALQAGANDFIYKNIMEHDLVPRMRKFLGYV